MGQPRPLFNLFLCFQTHITNFKTNRYVIKCPSSIRCRDLNSQPLEHESCPITTRPGLLSIFKNDCCHFKNLSHFSTQLRIFVFKYKGLIRSQIKPKQSQSGSLAGCQAIFLTFERAVGRPGGIRMLVGWFVVVVATL